MTLGDYPPGVYESDINGRELPDFDEWLDDPTDKVIMLFEEEILTQLPEVGAIAANGVFDMYRYASIQDPIFDAYWKIYEEWKNNCMSDETRKKVVELWEDSE